MPTAAARSEEGTVSGELTVVVYSPESPLRHPRQLMREIVTDLWRCRELTWILFMRDLKAQFRQSYFGYAWLFVPVIATTLVWMFLASMGVVNGGKTSIPYPVYVLLGSVIWGVFAASVSQPLNSFNASRPVFMKLKVPPEAFILSAVAQIVFEVLIKLVVLLPVLVVLGVPLASTAWLFPVGLACTVVVGLCVGFLLIPIGSLYTDVNRMITTALSFAMYLCPVVYAPPESGWKADVVNRNPLTSLVNTTRDWLTIGHSDYLPAMIGTTIAAAVLLVFGLVVFRVVLPHLVERMGM
ncbi:MAG: ABC transporter permease [Planctomycetaceae bacterium]